MESPVQTMAIEAWVQMGEKKYGKDPRYWQFRCLSCGHVQSMQSVVERSRGQLTFARVRSWIYFSCEGRVHPHVGCDWTLGGFFRLHQREVVDSDRERVPVFPYAFEPVKCHRLNHTLGKRRNR